MTSKLKSRSFRAVIEIIGINPFVFLPEDVLEQVFIQANKSKGKIPVKMWIEGHEFPQTLIRYSGHWRLYLNGSMREAANKEVGNEASFEIAFNPVKSEIPVHPRLKNALKANKAAMKVFETLSPSLRLEIVRYIANLKTTASVDRNVQRAINFLLGKERFIGREKP
jgi:AAA+ ATPase superfamily predicted ATPase